MPFHPRRFTLIALAVLLTLAALGPTVVAASRTPADPRTLVYQAAPAHAASDGGDDRRAVALGTLGAVVAAGLVAGAGYLYRRQAGRTPHYDDGFTPRDPRDHPSH